MDSRKVANFDAERVSAATPGVNAGRVAVGNVTPGRAMRKFGKVQAFTSAKAECRNVRPHTGKSEDALWERRNEYGGPMAEAVTLLDRLSATGAERRAIADIAAAGPERRERVARRELARLENWANRWDSPKVNRPAKLAALIQEALEGGGWN